MMHLIVIQQEQSPDAPNCKAAEAIIEYVNPHVFVLGFGAYSEPLMHDIIKLNTSKWWMNTLHKRGKKIKFITTDEAN